MSNVPRDSVDPYVLGWVRDNCVQPLLNDPDVRAEFEQQWASVNSAADAAGALRDRLDRLDRLVQKIMDTMDEENLPLVNTKLTQLREERAAIVTRLSAQIPAALSLEDARAKAQEYLTHAQRVLDAGTPQELKELVRCFVHRVELDPAARRGRLVYYAPWGTLREKLCIQLERVTGIEPV